MTDELQRFRSNQLRELPAESGVYALCDLDQAPIYVGKSVRSKAEGIRARVRRHLTSARSDVVANRQLDVWEVAYVWAWPVSSEKLLDELESHLFHKFDRNRSLVNGTVPPQPSKKIAEPDRIEIQVMADAEVAIRKQPRYRFPRQVQQFNQLLDYILHTKDETHLRRALDVHFRRVAAFYSQFKSD
jgi:hypothetical protein